MSNFLPYQDSKLPVEKRVGDLLSRMTIAEKVGQLMQLNGQEDPIGLVQNKLVGSLLHINGENANAAMRAALKTRLGIPLLIGDDAIHGHSFWPGATIFPTQLAMATSWSTTLLEKVARITALEMRPTGIRWTFSPVLCLARDLRWGRVGETFGEDPWLIGEFAAAMIRGYQGKGLDDPQSVMATAKHFAGYSETQGGRDASESDSSHRKLRSWFLPPFEKAAKSGCMSFMTGYQSMEGIPSTANRWLLTEVLKQEWGYEGIVVTDWDNVGRMVWEQHVCSNIADAAALAIKSGNDLSMTTPTFFEGAQEAIKNGLITEAELDGPVRRVLTLKFRLGLFEDAGYADIDAQKTIIHCKTHKTANLEVARASLVLLKNDGILPLVTNKGGKIAVIGPNADDPLAQLGDWSLGTGQLKLANIETHPRALTTTIVDGLKAHAPQGWSVEYQKGASITEADESGIPAAVALAQKSDIVVLAIGDNIHFTGEEKSTATLELQGAQIALAEELAKTGKPMVVVLINSKPLVLPRSVLKAAAIIEAFNPGMEGGNAIAEAIFGTLNPSGKLTISFPKHVGQQPMCYSQVRGQHGKRYADLDQDPVFAFGEGLSYTSFSYGAPRCLTPTVGVKDTVAFEIDVTNTGKRDGIEIVQLYIEDVVTSATWVNRELKAFARIELKAGETKKVSLAVAAADLSIVNKDCVRVVEPGDFKAWIGSSSREKDLQAIAFAVK